jgi:hypothetical protein
LNFEFRLLWDKILPQMPFIKVQIIVTVENFPVCIVLVDGSFTGKYYFNVGHPILLYLYH